MKLGEAQPFASPEEALKHHGVKGMKWGERKEEELVGRDPSGRVTASPKNQVQKQSDLSDRNQRRVEKFQKQSDVMSTKISELKLRNEALQGTRDPAKLYEKYANKQDIKNLGNAQKRAVRDAEAVQKGKLTSTQKKLIVGAVGVSAIIAVGVVYRGQQSGAFNSYALRGAAFLKGEKVPFGVNESLRGHMSASELLERVAKPVNPGYSKAGGKMNCRRSTFVYELRRRGFDVEATTSGVGWGQSESGVINALTPGSEKFYRRMSLSEAVRDTGVAGAARGDTRINPVTKVFLDNLRGRSVSLQEQAEAIRKNGGRMPADLQKVIDQAGTSSSAKVLAELAKQPNGARGEVLFKFPSFGHSMAYEIVDGVPHIFDSQKGTLYNASQMVESKWDGFSAAEITRLDNVDLDLNFLTRWADNARGK